MIRKALLAALAALAIAGCSTAPGTGVEPGARPIGLCGDGILWRDRARAGRPLRRLRKRQRRVPLAEDFAAREAAVSFRLAERHGAERSTPPKPDAASPCEELPTPKGATATSACSACSRPGLGWPRRNANVDFISILSIFVLACFVGYYSSGRSLRIAHAADGGDQRDLLGDHRRRADRRGGGRRARGEWLG